MNIVTEILLDEHKLLFDAIEAVKKIQKMKDTNMYRKAMHKFIVFFLEFTETYHHPKEEEILYPQLLKQTKNINNKIVTEISRNHNELNELINEAECLFNSKENVKLRKVINRYVDLLFNHIWRENAIIFKNISYMLSEKELKNITIKFKKLDDKHGKKNELKIDIIKLINKLNKNKN